MIESDAPALIKNRTNPHFFWVWAIPVFIVDQLTKQWIINNLRLNSSMYPVESWQPYLRWSHVANTGGVFGMFQGTTAIFTVLAGIVTLMIVWMNYSSKESALLARGTYGLILGGALGNLLDRIRIGHVTDFIDIDLSSIIPIGIADWYVFNVADMAIIGGIITLLVLSFVAPDKINLDG